MILVIDICYNVLSILNYWWQRGDMKDHLKSEIPFKILRERV